VQWRERRDTPLQVRDLILCLFERRLAQACLHDCVRQPMRLHREPRVIKDHLFPRIVGLISHGPSSWPPSNGDHRDDHAVMEAFSCRAYM
jgi:hypothetical protein